MEEVEGKKVSFAVCGEYHRTLELCGHFMMKKWWMKASDQIDREKCFNVMIVNQCLQQNIILSKTVEWKKLREEMRWKISKYSLGCFIREWKKEIFYLLMVDLAGVRFFLAFFRFRNEVEYYFWWSSVLSAFSLWHFSTLHTKVKVFFIVCMYFVPSFLNQSFEFEHIFDSM